MNGIVHFYASNTGVYFTDEETTKIGTLDGDCSILKMDPVAGEFVTQIEIQYNTLIQSL